MNPSSNLDDSVNAQNDVARILDEIFFVPLGRIQIARVDPQDGIRSEARYPNNAGCYEAWESIVSRPLRSTQSLRPGLIW